MKIDKRINIITIICTFIILIFFSFIILISFDKLEDKNISFDVIETDQVLNINFSANDKEKHETGVQEETNKVQIVPDKIMNTYEVGGVTFWQVDAGFNPSIYEITAYDAAKIMVTEMDRIFPEVSLDTPIVIAYLNNIQRHTTNGNWYLTMQQDGTTKIPFGNRKYAYIDGVTGKILSLYAFNKSFPEVENYSEPWLSKNDIMYFTDIYSMGNLSRNFIRKKNLSDGELIIKNPKLDFSLAYAGVIKVSSVIGTKDNADKIITYIDMGTKQVVGYEYIFPDNSNYDKY